RRRHTRFSRDWSSDVCSSDLGRAGPGHSPHASRRPGRRSRRSRSPLWQGEPQRQAGRDLPLPLRRRGEQQLLPEAAQAGGVPGELLLRVPLLRDRRRPGALSFRLRPLLHPLRVLRPPGAEDRRVRRRGDRLHHQCGRVRRRRGGPALRGPQARRGVPPGAGAERFFQDPPQTGRDRAGLLPPGQEELRHLRPGAPGVGGVIAGTKMDKRVCGQNPGPKRRMSVYSREERMKAVKLYFQYDRQVAPVLRELGYPSRGALRRWVAEFEATGDVHAGYRRERHPSKYSEAQKRAAVDYYLTHGRNLQKTVRALGYPNRDTLRQWLNERV